MNILMLIIMGFFISSCGKNTHDSASILADETDPMAKQTTSLEQEIQYLLSSGLHFTRFSNLQDPRRPMTLYCSNTTSLNFEKIERLWDFSKRLQKYNQETYLINKVEVNMTVLLQLVQDAVKTLEQDPYSPTCPQIYLAIQNP